jgi:predicted dehydrogenase
MSSEKFNVGVIGYGMSAKIFHIPFITHVPELHLYAVVQRTPKPGDDAESDHPGVRVFRSVTDLFEDEGVDVVIVTTAPDQHFSLTKQALEAGKHGEHPLLRIYVIFRSDNPQSLSRSPSPRPRERQMSWSA